LLVKKHQSTGGDDGSRDSIGLGNVDSNCHHAASDQWQQQAAAAVEVVTAWAIF